MPRHYERIIKVVGCHTSDGNHYICSIRYGLITINCIRYIRRTERNHRHQIIYPTHRLPQGDWHRTIPAVLPARGFTQLVIDVLEDWIFTQAKTCALKIGDELDYLDDCLDEGYCIGNDKELQRTKDRAAELRALLATKEESSTAA